VVFRYNYKNYLLFFYFIIKAGIFSLIASEKFNGKDKLKWGKNDGVVIRFLNDFFWLKFNCCFCSKGYIEHVVSTANEWSMAFTILIVLLTFYADFKHIILKKPEVIMKTTASHITSISDHVK
jgi:hypothetical protein